MEKSVIEYVNNITILGTNNDHNSLKIWNKDKYNHKHYFWFHYLFGDLYNSDKKFKELWDSTPKISSDGPNYIQHQGLLNKLSDNVKNHINKVKTPLYKLSYKYNMKEYNEECNLSYLINLIKLRFMHIPKTAGTSIENAAKNNNLLWGRFDTNLKSFKKFSAWHCPQNTLPYCFCVIRNPFDRLISQFYHADKIEDYNSKKLNNFIKVKIPQIKNDWNIDDNHFLPQYKFYEKCHIIILFDNLQNNLNNLMKIFDLPLLMLDKLPGGKRPTDKKG